MTRPYEMPIDYFDTRCKLGAKDASKHYGVSLKVIAGLDGRLTLDQFAEIEKQKRARHAARAAEQYRMNLKRNPASRGKGKKRQPFAPGVVAFNRGGVIEQAKQHLRRHYSSVFDAGAVYGKAWHGLFVVGKHKVDRDGLLALAAEAGFDANAWRAVNIPVDSMAAVR